MRGHDAARPAEHILARHTHPELRTGEFRTGPHTLHYVVCGTGKPLLLIHGINIGWGTWYRNIATLARHFRVYAIDLPGAGGSSDIKFRATDLIKDFVVPLERFIARNHLGNVRLVGHSFGGWIALTLALRKRVRVDRMALVSPVGFSMRVPWRHWGTCFHALARILAATVVRPTRKNMRLFLQGVLAKTHTLDDRFVDYFHESVRQGTDRHPFFMMHRLVAPFRFRSELDLRKNLAAASVPLLVVLGAQDPIFPRSVMASAFHASPNVRVEIFPGVGHVAPIEASTRFNRSLIRFFRAPSTT